MLRFVYVLLILLTFNQIVKVSDNSVLSSMICNEDELKKLILNWLNRWEYFELKKAVIKLFASKKIELSGLDYAKLSEVIKVIKKSDKPTLKDFEKMLELLLKFPEAQEYDQEELTEFMIKHLGLYD